MKGDIEFIKGDEHISHLCPKINEIIEVVTAQQTKINELEDRLRRHILNDDTGIR